MTPVATLSDAPTFETEGFTFRSLAVPSRGSRELAIWQVTGAAGARSVRHCMSREEVFVVLDGLLTATIDDLPVTAIAGDALVVPAGAMLELSNDGAVPLRLMACTSVGMQATVGDATFAPPWAL